MPDAAEGPLRPVPTLVWRAALDEVVLLDRASGETWLLDPSGAAIWDAVIEGGSIAAATSLLPAADADEVTRFVRDLIAKGTLDEARSDG